MIYKIFRQRTFRHDMWFFYFFPLLLSLAIFIWVIYPKFQVLRWHKEVVQEKERRLLSYKENIEILKKELAKPKFDVQSLENKVFSGKDPYIIVAYIQEKIKTISGLSVRSFRITKKTKETDFLEKIIATFILQADVKGLIEMLWRLQNEQKAVKISKLSVYVRGKRATELLNIRLEIESLFLSEVFAKI